MPPVDDGGASSAAAPRWMTPPDPATSPDVFTTAKGMGVRVEPDVLKTFSQQTGAEAMAFRSSVGNGVNPLLQLASTIGAGTEATGHFASVHGDRVQQLMAFAQDVGVGLAAFSAGSSTIALNYVDSDSTQSATMQQVVSAFHPPAGRPSLRREMDAAAAQQATATAEDQAVVDRTVASLELPEPTDLTPDQDAPAPGVDERAGGQTVPLGDSGSVYVVDRDYDLEGKDANQILSDMADGVRDGDTYAAPQPDGE